VRLSVIIPTRNRAHAIVGCLNSVAKSLACAAPLDAEIVVVDNASTDETSAAVEAWGTTSIFPVRVILEPKPGISRARNCGFRTARGQFIVCTDDDCRMSEDYIQAALRHDADDVDLVLRGGRVELGDPTDLALSIKTSTTSERWSRSMKSAQRQNLGNCILGCNMTLRRALFEKLGPFDERLGTPFLPASEDTDYILRAYLAGVTVEYVPDMTVFHHHGRKQVTVGHKLMRNYIIGSGALYAKHFFKDPNLARQFYWDLKNLIREIWAGKNGYMPEIEFSYKTLIGYNLLGAARYIASCLSR
jgi:glycosyltransferase involved in cell wall biosynthesis